MYDIILAFITAFLLTFVAIPSIISVAKKKNLVDEPGGRRAHTESTPSLGGIAIFAGVIFSIVLWTPFKYFGDLQYIICAFIIIFLIGAKDDIDPVAASKKFVGQIFAATILVFKANVKLTSLYGILGIYELPEIVSIGLSIFAIVAIINAFNLLDGINGLSGLIGSLISCVMGSWFFLIDHVEIAIVAFSLAGSLMGFLKYNISPAKIFMGDTGSLLLGLVCSILAIKFIELNNEVIDTPYYIQSAPAVAFGVLILPLFDMIRVFFVRIVRGKSPFSPDRTHIHHLLLDSGFQHMPATYILVAFNILFMLFVYFAQGMGSFKLLIVEFVIVITLSGLLWKNANRVKASKNA